jgi:hypothetical protein
MEYVVGLSRRVREPIFAADRCETCVAPDPEHRSTRDI